HETPALAAEKKQSYARRYGNAYAGAWYFLTGNQSSISNLAAQVGFRYAYDPAVKMYAHPSGLMILSSGGEVARYFFGVNFAAKDVDAALRASAENQISSKDSQFTLLCFPYAPVHGKYGKLVMTIVRAGSIVVLGTLAYLVWAFPQ